MTESEHGENAGVTTDALVDAIVIAALTLPVEERVAFVMSRVDRIREVYAKRHADDDRQRADALSAAKEIEERVNLKLAQIEARGIAQAS